MRGDAICMYTPSGDGGMAQYAWELMHALAAEGGATGRRFELVTASDLQEQFRTDAYPVHDVLPPIRHRSQFPHRAAWVADRLTHYARRDWRFLRWLDGRPDVVAVHLQEWTPWLAAPVLRRIRATGKAVFYTVHNVVPHHYPALLPRAVMDRWIRKASRMCDGLFVHTDRLAAELSRRLGGDHPPIHVVPHGIWTVPPRPAPPSLDERLAARRLLFFGTIRRNKGLHLLLAAMRELPKAYSLTIAGEPHEAEYYRAEVLPLIGQLREAGVKVDLIDRFVPDAELRELFESHGAVVLPYTKAFVAQSGVIFLSLAYDLPVVASEAGGLRDLFAEYQVGRTFREESPGALAAAIESLFAGDSRRGLADEIRRAKQRYSWREAAAATIAGYDAVLNVRRTDEEMEPDGCVVATTAAR